MFHKFYGQSIKLKIDTTRPRKDKTCAVYLQVIIDRKKIHIGLALSWPPDRFNENSGCQARFKKDPLVNNYNILINNARSKANQIIIDNRIKDKPMNIELFEREYYSKLSKVDFVKYLEIRSSFAGSRRFVHSTESVR
ncbi:MAG: Arm DNA-binding domain-containing protein [Cyclobacteriaceae bacterium]